MTQEEVENNYTYKIVRKVLMREYPWIKDVRFDVPGLEKFDSVIFLELYINPYELANQYGWKVGRWIDSSVRLKEPYSSMSFSIFFVGSTEEMRELKVEIEDTIRAVQESSAIPPELRLPDRRFTIGDIITTDNLTVPEPEPNDIDTINNPT